MRSEEPSFHFDVQNVETEVEQMGLPQLSRGQPRPSQQPIIDFAVVEDSDGDDENENEDGNGEYGFFAGVVSNPGDEDEWDDSDDTWSDDSSRDSDESNWFHKYGGWYFNPSSWRFEPVYRFVQPDLRTSCNATAAALKEPISLLTKYRHQRLGHESKYFHKSIPNPSKALRRARQVSRGSRLKKVQNVDDQAVRWA